MTTITTHTDIRTRIELTAEETDLTAVETDGTWVVEDAAGGRWFPGDEAEAEILASSDPAATAVRICRESPMRGTWHS